jgi:hypothetical protein
VYLVIDKSPAHRTFLVKAYVASTDGTLTLHFLPRHAPELNPNELVRSHMKHSVARAPLRRGETLRDKIEARLAAIKRIAQLVRSFFQAPNVAYITDRLANGDGLFSNTCASTSVSLLNCRRPPVIRSSCSR